MSLARPGLTAFVLHGRENATHDIGLILIEFGAIDKTANALHQMFAARRSIAEANLL
jgi:hypothetical protein